MLRPNPRIIMSTKHDQKNYLEVAERAAVLSDMFRNHAAGGVSTAHERKYAETMAVHYDAIARINLEMADVAARWELPVRH